MSSDLPSVPFMALYIISLHIIQSNSRTSTHWKLQGDRVVEVTNVFSSDSSLTADSDQTTEMSNDVEASNIISSPSNSETDPMFGILTNKLLADGGWKLTSLSDQSCVDCEKEQQKMNEHYQESMILPSNSVSASTHSSEIQKPEKDKNLSHAGKSNTQQNGKSSKNSTTKQDVLDCGPPVNSTQFDHLRGVASRNDHPHVPEPEVALIFKKRGSRSSEVDMSELEKRLRKSLKERPKSPQVYNQIGNFWRIKGNTQLSIECFRKALAIAPTNADVLLNLARVLFNLQFLDDAIYLTRRSLEAQLPDQNSWLQHFTLGEILKAYGHFSEATFHFRHTLELKSNFQPAVNHLKEMESSPDGTVTYYTLFIILFLVMTVLCGFLTTVETTVEAYGESLKSQRSFNRAMQIRSLKLAKLNPRLMRVKKGGNC